MLRKKANAEKIGRKIGPERMEESHIFVRFLALVFPALFPLFILRCRVARSCVRRGIARMTPYLWRVASR